MKIYLAGPMTGKPAFNFPTFFRAAKLLRREGHDVFSPAEHDLANGFNPAGMEGRKDEMATAGFSLRKALGEDLTWITGQAEALVVLPGWEDSKGARAEVETARAIGVPIYEFGLFLLYGEFLPRSEEESLGV